MVYFIQAGNAVKIGYAKEVNQRLKALQTGHHEKLTVLHTIITPDEKEDRRLEKLFHRALRTHHINKEWFSMDVMNLIDFNTKTIIWGDGGLHFTAMLNVR
jgi:hypothetical protein